MVSKLFILLSIIQYVKILYNYDFCLNIIYYRLFRKKIIYFNFEMNII